MGYYVIIGQDAEGSLPRRREARPAHLARLTALEASGRLLLAGPCPAVDQEDPAEAGFSGSLIVAAFASLEEARQWADEDPYVAAGVYRSVEVRRFKKVFPNP
ncbi:MAG: YciI family protein [Magnetococcales bacterium]|nr:YciI family protein [Magnetococcales bacterium]